MPPKKGRGAAAEEQSADDKYARFGRVRNTLKMGLVGLPNVGKSSLFNLMTEQAVPAENFPFCTIDPSEAKCAVPDQRFKFLCDLYDPPSKVPATLSVTDIAGLIKGASDGAGLGNAFLSHIAAVDGIFHVIRAFEDDAVVHVDDSIDAVRDLETIQGELCAKDLDLANGCYTKAIADARKKQGISRSATPTGLDGLTAVHERIIELLEGGHPVGQAEWTNHEIETIRIYYQLITTKPIIYLVNLSKRDFCRKKNRWLPRINNWVQERGGGLIIPVSVEFEQEHWALHEDPEAQAAFREQCKTEFCNSEGPPIKSSLPRIIKCGFKALNLINYFTVGDTEVKAWVVFRGATAPQAAGVIHSDFERGFIKAETCAYDDFKRLCGGRPTMAAVKDAGRYRQEGRQYIVQDGDIMLFQFNVTAKKK